MLLQKTDTYDRATELVHVEKIVPEKFVLVSILSEFQWLHDLVESVHQQYEANKRKESEIKV